MSYPASEADAEISYVEGYKNVDLVKCSGMTAYSFVHVIIQEFLVVFFLTNLLETSRYRSTMKL